MSYYWDRYQIVYVNTYYEDGWGPTYGSGVKNSSNPSYGYSGYGFSSSSGYYMVGGQNTYYTGASFYNGGGSSITLTTIYDNQNGSANYNRQDKGSSVSQEAAPGSHYDTIIAEYDTYMDNAQNGGYWYVRGSEVNPNNPPSAPTSIVIPGTVNTSATITWSLGSDADQDTLSTYVDLAVDGSTYKAIGNVGANATSLVYNFQNETESTSAKLRLRHYDGATYSAYAYSAVFTIDHTESPPPTPTLASPVGGEFWTGVQNITWDVSDVSTEIVEDFEDTTFAFNRVINSLSWSPTSTQAYTFGTKSFRAYPITHSEVSAETLQINVPPGAVNPTLTMRYYVSSENNYDWLRIYLDGVEKIKVSGTSTTTWRTFTHALNIGLNELKYEYKKDGSASSGEDTAYVDDLRVTYQEPASNLQFHIQLSNDGSSLWKDIVALTAVDATSYSYNFSNELDSTTAKLRIRSYSPSSGLYSPWSTMSNPFTIYSVPNPPTLTSLTGTSTTPVNGYRENSSSLEFSWNYSHPNGIAYGSYGMEILNANTGVVWWSTNRTYTNGTSTQVYLDMSTEAGVVHRWRARVWDANNNVSAWSDYGYFIPYKKPVISTKRVALGLKNSVLLSGEVLDLGGDYKVEFGFIYGTSNIQVTNTKLLLGLAELPGSIAEFKEGDFFEHTLTGLTPGTYYFQAYATNKVTTSYGVEKQVIIPAATTRTRVAKLSKNGIMQVSGEITERMPAVLDGLSAYFPFDGAIEGKSFGKNLLNMSDWVVGKQGTQGMFGVNGASSEANVINYTNPWGVREPTWASLKNDAASDADGGWNVTGRPIDRTKKYRLSVWIKREDVGGGTTYFGCQGSTVCNLSNSAVNTNPYFLAGKFIETYENWTLFVAYIHPHDYASTASDPTNGVYRTDGTKARGATDYKWAPTATVGGHRTYLYYSTSTEERQYWQRPRFEVCDGTEASISDLLKGFDERVNPITNTNTTLTNNGVGVEDSRTNYLSAGLNGYHALETRSWIGGAVVEVGSSSLNTPIFRYKTDGTSYTLTHDYVLDDDLATLSGQTVTFSLYLKRIEGPATGRIRIYDDITSYSYQNVETTGEFQKFSMTKVLGANPTRIFVMIDNTGGGTYDFHSPQLEISPFATSYVNGSRSNGRLDLPIERTEEYTITGEFLPASPLQNNTTYNTTANSSALLRVEDTVKVGGFYYRFYLSGGTTSAPYLDPDGYYGTSHIHNSYQIDANKPVYFAIRKSGTTAKIKFHQDGWRAEHVATVPADAGVNVLRIGNTTIWNGVFRNVAIYKRSLLDSELDKIVGETFSVTKESNVIAKEIGEGSAGLPKDVIHMPLGVNGKDTHQFTNPVNEAGTAYKDGAVWVGSATTNLAAGTVTVYGPYHSHVREGQKFTFTMIGDNKPLVFSIGTITGKTFAISGYMKKNGIPTTITSSVASTYNAAVDNKRKFFDTRTGYFEFVEYYSHATSTWLFHCYGDNFMDGDIITIEDLQVEERDFNTAFTSGTRPYSRLSYTGTDLTTNSWQEFSLSMNVKYSQVGVYRLSGAWSRFYFGLSPSNTLMLSWVDGTQQSVSASGTVPINEWVTVGVTVKNNVAIDLYVNGIRVGGRGTGFNLSSTAMDFELNSLSPTDASYPLNAWVKDLVFAKRALTAEEMKNIALVNMRMTKNMVTTKNGFIENSII